MNLVEVGEAKDIIAFFKEHFEKLLIILDVELRSLQVEDDFGDVENELNRLWRSLHSDNRDRNLIVISTGARSPSNIISLFKPENSKRFQTGKQFPSNPGLYKTFPNPEAEPYAKVILDDALQKWLDLSAPSRILLRALVKAQEFFPSSPCHPESWAVVPEKFELRGCIDRCIEVEPNEAFKSLFCYTEQDSRWKDPDVGKGVSYTTTDRRYLTAQTVECILKYCGLTISLENSDQEIRLPGTPGICFLWRLVRFIESLNDQIERQLTMKINGDIASLSIQFPDLCEFITAVDDKEKILKNSGAVRAYRALLICEKPSNAELTYIGAANWVISRIACWNVAFQQSEQGMEQDTALSYPAVKVEPDEKTNTLSFSWKFPMMRSSVPTDIV